MCSDVVLAEPKDVQIHTVDGGLGACGELCTRRVCTGCMNHCIHMALHTC
jgi:hypothetical protein